MVVSAEYSATRDARAFHPPASSGRFSLPDEPAQALTAPVVFSLVTRACACYCPRSGYAFDWLAQAVQDQATAVSRLEAKVDRLTVLLEAAFAAELADAGVDHGEDGFRATRSGSDPSVESQSSAASDRGTSTFQPDHAHAREVAAGPACTSCSRSDNFVRKLLNFAGTSVAPSAYPAAVTISSSSLTTASTDEYERLSTTSHDSVFLDSNEEQDDAGSSSCAQEGDQQVADGVGTRAPELGRPTVPPHVPVESWLESVE
ncbi:hypothetical protein JCM3774_004405 [Rhodotorula dairenensis]